VELFEAVSPYTMTTAEAIYALADAVRYTIRHEIPGAVVECGVWRGGSMMTVARTLLEAGRSDVELYLFDTFQGMSAPTEADFCWTGERADDLLAGEARDESSVLWAQATLVDVRAAMEATGYPSERIHYVEGRAEETLPAAAPDQVALLRLDTDWYESTKHELLHLYPRLAPGGVLILDDYGWWRGAAQATHEYFGEHPPAPLLVRVDDGGTRIAVKPH
jgi:O-methyltransferase